VDQLLDEGGEAVDTVRKQEHRAVMAEGDKSVSGSKYLWLYAQENHPKRHAGRFASGCATRT
jgi:transposase